MATNLKFVAYKGPPSRTNKQQTKTSVTTLTPTTNKRDQQMISPLDSFLAPEGDESQLDIVASQPSRSQNLEVPFDQSQFGGSGPASPNEFPLVDELLERLKATRTSALDGEHTTTTKDNPDSSLGMDLLAQLQTCSDSTDSKDEGVTRGSSIVLEDGNSSDYDSDGVYGKEAPKVSRLRRSAILELPESSEIYATTPRTTASSPSITTAKTSPPQSHPDDSECPTGSAENTGLVEDDVDQDNDEDLSDVDSCFVGHHRHVAAKRGAGHPVQPAKRHRSHDASGSDSRDAHSEDGERPRNAKRHKPSPTKTHLASAGGQHPGRKYGLRRLPSRRQESAARSLVNPRRTLPQRGSGPISRLRDMPRADRIAIRSSRSGDSPLSSPISFPAVRKAASDCCHACGISVQSILGRISTTLNYIPLDFELFASIHGGILSQSDKVALTSLLCLQGIRGDIAACSIKANTPTSRTDSEDLRPKYNGDAVDATDGRLSCDGMSDGDSSSGSTERDSSDDDVDSKSIGGVSGEDNHHSRGKGRLWTKLEEERLRVYVKEKKQWGWIASQLRRTEGAVRVHWSLMGRK